MIPVSNNTAFSSLTEVEVVKLNHINVNDVLDIVPSFLQEYIRGNNNGDTLTITAPENEIDKIKELINKIDTAQKQIEVKVVVTEVDSKYVKDFGSNLIEFSENEETNNSLNFEEGLLVLETDFYGRLISNLKLMEEDHLAEVKADPKVMVADGETAQLFVGEQQILLLTAKDDYISRTEEVEVGVGLEVTANTIGDNRVKLKITPQVSRFVDSMRPDLVVKQNTVSTTVLLESGQTLLLAGMTMRDESSSISSVPVLGSIPLIRWLFRNEQEINTDKELLVFVTPVIHN